MTRRNAHCGGFTLVELMVSIAGGLFVAIAVFMLAKQSTAIYQSEGRAGNATLGSLIGFERLRQDIERASFLSSPNIRTDPKLCCFAAPIANPGGWPAYLAHLQGVMITQATNSSVIPAVLSKNGSKPDEITLSGSYASDQRFFADVVFNNGGTDTVTLEANSGGLGKVNYLGSTKAVQDAIMASTFQPGRALRIVDKSNGREEYGTIAAATGGSPPTITLVSGAAGPSLTYRSGSACQCGVSGYSRSSVVNVVNIIHYSIQDMSGNAAYAPLFDNSGRGPANESAARAELVREELDTTGTPIAGTQEVVSEFAVDLKFGITAATLVPGSTQVTSLLTFAPGSQSVVDWAGDTTPVVGPAAAMPPGAPPTPQLVRAVRVRLGVRSREADRSSALDGGAGLGVAPGLYRIGTNPAGGGPFARVRTMQADIALRNQEGVNFL